MRLPSLVSAVGSLLLTCVAALSIFVAYLLCCGVGLALSSDSITVRVSPTLLISVAVIAALGTVALLYVAAEWRRRSLRRRRWYVATVLGIPSAVVGAGAALLHGLLLTSATWGQRAGSDLPERDRIVGAIAPTWQWWLLVLTVAVIASVIALGAGPDPAGDGKKRYGWGARIAFVAVPASLLGTLVTTSMVSLPGGI